jgi:ATP-dependent HslUV protease ATP-binding subunit HslU
LAIEEIVTTKAATPEKVDTRSAGYLTPHQVVRELDKFIIGQSNAKRSVAIALRNRWRRQQVSDELRDEIMPNNIIMIGPTGVGKTEIARRLAKLAGAPFIKVEATKYTEVGYVGRDVESMIRDLAEHAVTMVKSERMAEVQVKAEEIAEQRILDILIPPMVRPEANTNHPPQPNGFPPFFPGFPGNISVSTPATAPRHNGIEEQRKKDAAESSHESPMSPREGGDRTVDDLTQAAETNDRTRDRFRVKINKREMEEREIEVELEQSPQIASMQIMGPFGGGMDDVSQNLQDMLGNMMPKKQKRRRLTIKEARKIFTQEEAAKLIDMDAVQREAIDRAQNSGIVFLDEIDKVAGKSREGSGPDVSREGVQRDLLPIVEGSNVTTRYGVVKTDHILFIASGAFHVAKPSDLIPELQGRFPIRVELESLTEEDFVKILTVPENALLKQYVALLRTEGVEVTFTPEAIRAVARIAFEVNEAVENIGARRLHTIMTTLLEQLLFDVPDKIEEKQITITDKLVEERLERVVRDRDLSKYIL